MKWKSNPLRLNLQYFGDPEPEHESEVKFSVVTDEKGEKGSLHLDGIELKASKEEKGVIEGYASTFGNIDRHGDIIEAGAFKGSRKRIPIFGMHNPHLGIGTGTVTEDDKGLRIKIKLAVDNEDSDILRERAKEYYAMAKEGIIERLSIGFSTLDQEFTKKKVNGKDRIIRLIKKVDLMETSLVPIPANDKARIVNIKSLEDLDSTQREMFEKLYKEELNKKDNEILKLQTTVNELTKDIRDRKSLDSILNNPLGGLYR